MGPAELWKQWYDMTSSMWSNMLGGDSGSYMDPFGLYQQWFSNLEDARKQTEGGTGGTPSSEEMWRQWIEATTGAWTRAGRIGTILLGFAPRWVEMTEEVRKQMLGGGGLPTDPLDFYLRLYSATSGPLSKMIRELLENEEFLESSRRLLENRASLERIFHNASEEYFGDYLQLATRSDSSRVAALVVGLEDKVDRIEETFEEFEYGYKEPATAESMNALENRMNELENKLDDNRSGLDRVESKLDQLLAALDTAANGNPQPTGSRASSSQQEVRATDAARRTAEELSVNLEDVEGSGPGGRITVDDVRKEGES